MDYDKPSPRYSVGDLVRCSYEFYQYYYSVWDLETAAPHYGVIVEIDFATYNEIFGYEILYVVLCLDGSQRFFTEEEIYKIS